MATFHGSVSEFNPDTEDWVSYTERMQYYFTANEVTSVAKQRSILLAAFGIPTLKLIKSLIDSDKLDTTSYADIIKKVKEYYVPIPSLIVQRYKFNTRSRLTGETVTQYLAQLRQLFHHCEYGDSVSDMLRDRLGGVNHDGIQRKLLSEKKLTFDTAYELAVAVETAERDAKDMKRQTNSHSLNNVHYSTQKQNTAPLIHQAQDSYNSSN